MFFIEMQLPQHFCDKKWHIFRFFVCFWQVPSQRHPEVVPTIHDFKKKLRTKNSSSHLANPYYHSFAKLWKVPNRGGNVRNTIKTVKIHLLKAQPFSAISCKPNVFLLKNMHSDLRTASKTAWKSCQNSHSDLPAPSKFSKKRKFHHFCEKVKWHCLCNGCVTESRFQTCTFFQVCEIALLSWI